MEAAIRAGRVTVDGQTVTAQGVQIDPETQAITLDGDRVVPAEGMPAVVALHKPAGILTTTHDPRGRPTVLGLLPKSLRQQRLYPVGRLDLESEGLVLLTSDGELAFQLMHPRFGHEREYEVTVRGREPAGLPQRLLDGIDIGERRAARALRAAKVDGRWRLVLTEGRKRQVRRMFEALGLRVTKLRRVRIASIELGELAPGEARELDAAEVQSLRQGAGLAPAAPTELGGDGAEPANR